MCIILIYIPQRVGPPKEARYLRTRAAPEKTANRQRSGSNALDPKGTATVHTEDTTMTEFTEMSLGQLFNAAHEFDGYTTQEKQENLQAQLDWELEEIKNLLSDEELAELFGE